MNIVTVSPSSIEDGILMGMRGAHFGARRFPVHRGARKVALGEQVLLRGAAIQRSRGNREFLAFGQVPKPRNRTIVCLTAPVVGQADLRVEGDAEVHSFEVVDGVFYAVIEMGEDASAIYPTPDGRELVQVNFDPDLSPDPVIRHRFPM